MAKNKELVNKYKEFYGKVRNLADDPELFPLMEDKQFEEFVSPKDWMGIPSFSISKKEMTNSDMGHLAIWMEGDKKLLDLWFNGIRAVSRFTNLLNPLSRREHEDFIALVKSLDERYKIRLVYAEKFYAGSADWQQIFEIKCKDLTDENIKQLLESIKITKEKRDRRQIELKTEKDGKSKVATIAISLAEVELNTNNEEDLREIIIKLSKLTRICYDIKSSREIKNIVPILESLKQKKLMMEKGLDLEATDAESRWLKTEISKLEEE